MNFDCHCNLPQCGFSFVTSFIYVEIGLLLRGYVWLTTFNVSCLAYHVRNEYFAGNMNIPNSTPWPHNNAPLFYIIHM